MIKIEKSLKDGKKNNYDREICPDIETFGNRCNVCCFWQKLIRIKLMTSKRAKKFFNIKTTDLEKLFAIKYSGCAILNEICPNCIVDLKSYKDSKLVPMKDSEYNKELVCEPALLDYNDKKKVFYCEVCEKEFKHKEVKHLIDTMTLLKVEHPDWFKKKDGKGKQKQ